MTITFPYLTSYDPQVPAKPCSARLGIYQIADQLAVQSVPAVREQMQRTRRALKPLLSGAPLSKSAVSILVGRLGGNYEHWRQRDLAGDLIVYLYLDADAA